MYELAHRCAIALMLFTGALTMFVPPETSALLESSVAGLLVHRQFMLSLLGAGLVLAAFVPSWRLPALAAAVLSKGALLVLAGSPLREAAMFALLLAATAILAREAWQDARWHGVLPLRAEF